ncbi:MAG: RnfH family protein [Pseudomonadota bacterium]|nr:RnfH family protein [Pseudomonadota bacterium]
MKKSDPAVDAMWVEIAYCGRGDQTVLRVEVPPGTTVGQVLHRSGLLDRYPEIDLGVNRIGVFGVLRGLCHALEPGDRVEIYRPLATDPKRARRVRARARP